MPQESAELFLLSGTTPLGGWGHGSGVLSGHAQAGMSFRRGVKLDAEVDLQGRLEGSVGKDLSATLKAGVDVRAAAVVQAQIPLDLFTEAGLVARADLAVAASAYVALEISLQLHELEQLVHDQVPAPAGDLVAILIDEFRLSAGLWAKAAFAAELHAQAALVGSLLGDDPGFTFSFEAAAGLGASAGVSFLLNAGFPDPDRLVRRLSDQLATNIVALLPEDSAAERRIRSAAHLVLPGLLGASMSAGRQLVSSRAEDSARAAAGGAMVGGVVARSLDVLFSAALDIAFDELQALLRDSAIAAAMAGVTDKSAALALIGRLGTHLDALGAPGRTPAEVFGAILDVVADVEQLTTLPGLPSTFGDLVTAPLATIWAIGAVVEGVVSASSSADLSVSFLNGAPTQDPGPALRAAYGGDLSYRHLVSYVADEVTRLLSTDPEATEVVHLVGEVLSVGADVVGTVISLAGKPPVEIGADVVHAILTGGAHLLTGEVLPALDAVTTGQNPDIHVFVDDFAKPVLTSAARVLPDALTDLATSDDRMRAREALSSVILCLLGSGVVTLADILLQHASAHGSDSAQNLAQSVRSDGTDAPAYRQLAAAGHGGSVAPESVATGLDHVGAIVPRIGGDKMKSLLDEVGSAFRGTGGAGGAAEVTSILTTDDVPVGLDLGQVVSLSAERAVEMAGDLFAEMFAEIGKAIVHLAEVITDGLDKAATAVLQVLKDGVALAQKTVDEIKAELDRIRQDLERFMADVLDAAARLAQVLRAGTDRFIGNLLAALDVALHRTLPKPIADIVCGTLRGMLHGLQEVIDLFADIVTDVAQVLSNRLRAAANAGQLTNAMFDDHVRAVVYNAPRHDIHLAIPIPFGSIPVTIDVGSAAGAAMDVLLGSPVYAPSRSQAVNNVAAYASSCSARIQAQAAFDSANVRAAMAARVAALQTGVPVSVAIESPTAGSINGDQVRATIRLKGANQTYLQAQSSFGMPNRVQIVVNDTEVVSPGMDWVGDGADLLWQVDLVSVVPVVPPLQQPVMHRARSVPIPSTHRHRSLPDDAVVGVRISPRQRPAYVGPTPRFAAPPQVPRSLHNLNASAWHPSLAVQPGVNTLAVIVADGSGGTDSATAVFVMSAPKAITSELSIAGVAYNPPEGEHVVLQNVTTSPVALAGWTVRDTARHRLNLPVGEVAPGGRVRIFTGAGSTSGDSIYLGRRRPVWNNTGDTAMLYDPNNQLASTFTYVGGSR